MYYVEVLDIETGNLERVCHFMKAENAIKALTDLFGKEIVPNTWSSNYKHYILREIEFNDIN